MRRLSLLIYVLALVLAACAPSSTSSSTTELTGTASTAPPETTATTGPGTDNGVTTTVPASGSTVTTSDRPLAPDFTLELGDGGTYTLSEGDKPVYLVFWAEW
ncbi:MAG TPA: hypothetical protein VFS66_02620 [Acidimicrobiia bacterium]|nr:hypothetical protein [Acidimicrobiia bacterium]